MKKSKQLASMMALIGGVVGIHKFYLEKQGEGVLYAILSLVTLNMIGFPIGLILGIRDAMRINGMSQEEFDKRYNSHSTRSQRHQQVRRQQKRKHTQNKEYTYKETRKPKANPFRKSAQQKYKEYDLTGALEDYKQSMEISELDAKGYFDMACIYSLMEQTDESLKHLSIAVSKGFNNFEKIKTVDELAYVRIQEAFETFEANSYKYQSKKPVPPPEGDLLQDDVLLSQLNRLKELRTKGILSDREFATEKEKLLRK